MTKLGTRLIKAAKEAHAIIKGELDPATYTIHVSKKVNVKKIREELHLSQRNFALIYHIPTATLQDWEQERRSLDTASRAYLTVIKRAPRLVARTLQKSDEEAKARKKQAASVLAQKVKA